MKIRPLILTLIAVPIIFVGGCFILLIGGGVAASVPNAKCPFCQHEFHVDRREGMGEMTVEEPCPNCGTCYPVFLFHEAWRKKDEAK